MNKAAVACTTRLDIPILVIMQLRKRRDYASLGERNLQWGVLPMLTFLSVYNNVFFRATLEQSVITIKLGIHLIEKDLFNLLDNEMSEVE